MRNHWRSTASCMREQVVFYTHWMARLTSAPAVMLVYLFFAVSAALQR